MRTSKTKIIGDVSYTVNQLGATAAVDLSIDLLKFAGPAFPIQQLLQGVKVKDGNIAFSLEGAVDLATIDLQGALSTLLKNLDKQTFKEVAKVMASMTTVDNVGPLSELYEAHFSKYGLLQLLKWLAFAVTTQYSDFFGALPSSKGTANKTPDQSTKANL